MNSTDFIFQGHDFGLKAKAKTVTKAKSMTPWCTWLRPDTLKVKAKNFGLTSKAKKANN